MLAFAVAVHLGTILYAVRGGLTAGRDPGAHARQYLASRCSTGLFVVAVAIHAPIGLRNVLREWTRWRGRSLDCRARRCFRLLLLALGLRAVFAVFTA